jgi:hypothetical protein
MLPGHSVLGEAASRCAHLVKGGDAVSRLEFVDVGPDGVDDAGNVVASVRGFLCPYGHFPEGWGEFRKKLCEEVLPTSPWDWSRSCGGISALSIE